MLRATIFAVSYLALSTLALLAAWALQAVLSIPLLKAARSDGFDTVGAFATLATVWVAFAILSLAPIWLVQRRAPQLRILSISPLILGLAGFIFSALGLVTALSRATETASMEVAINTSAWSATASVLLFAAVLLHLVVAVRAAPGVTAIAD